MLPLAALLATALGGAIVGIIIVSDWSDVLKNVKKFLTTVKDVWRSVRSFVPHETRILGDRIGDMIEIISTVYFQEDNQWYKQTAKQKIDASEVPSDIRERIRRQTDITQRMEQELRLA